MTKPQLTVTVVLGAVGASELAAAVEVPVSTAISTPGTSAGLERIVFVLIVTAALLLWLRATRTSDRIWSPMAFFAPTLTVLLAHPIASAIRDVSIVLAIKTPLVFGSIWVVAALYGLAIAALVILGTAAYGRLGSRV